MSAGGASVTLEGAADPPLPTARTQVMALPFAATGVCPAFYPHCSRENQKQALPENISGVWHDLQQQIKAMTTGSVCHAMP